MADRNDVHTTETLQQSTLAEFLDGTRRESQSTRLLYRLGKAIDDNHGHAVQAQFACEHESSGAGSRDNYVRVKVRHLPSSDWRFSSIPRGQPSVNSC